MLNGPAASEALERRAMPTQEKAEYADSANTEQYNQINENEFLEAVNNPLSTFSIDVDSASYSNVRRFINDGMLPPRDAVRIEEMINYFRYDYAEPEDDHPFSINAELAECPWNYKHKLVQIGLQGKKMPVEDLPASNLVFLVDVSGSMNQPDKLPLLKSAFRLLVNQVRPQDRVAIAVYAGNAGLVLPATSGDNKEEILAALNSLEAGGSTAGGAGIQLAYKVAKDNFIESGNNRVILATDGDFNVGVSSDDELVRLIESKRDDGIYLTVLGFGKGNLKDSKMEQLADKGNGQYAYIDGISEARKVLVNELGATLYTIAKDVKIQVEFNPAEVQAYRLIGYENRLLRSEDFNDDKRDAGELGAGHSVTALYEIIPRGVAANSSKVDGLKYQEKKLKPEAFGTDELMTIKLRYKPPSETESKLMAKSIFDSNQELRTASSNLKFSAAVAEFGLLLRDSKFKSKATYSNCLALAKQAVGNDEGGHRTEFISLVEKTESLKQRAN
jgi:Ca-activated chloride channel family protein